MKGNRLIVPNTDGIGEGGVKKKRVEGNGLIVSNTNEIMEEESRKTRDVVVQTHRIKYG